MSSIQRPPKLLNPDPRLEQWLYQIYLVLGLSSNTAPTALSDGIEANTGLITTNNYSGNSTTNTPDANYMNGCGCGSNTASPNDSLALHWMEV